MGIICDHSGRDSLKNKSKVNAEIQKPNEITDSEKSIISSKGSESNKIKNDIKNSNNKSNNNSINNNSKNIINSNMTKSIKNNDNINISNNSNNNSNNNNSINNNSINNNSTNDNIKSNKENNSYIFKSEIEPISQNNQKISVGLYSDSDKELINQIGEEIDEKTRNISDSTSKKTIKIIEFNFEEKKNEEIEKDKEGKIGCGQHSINTFCLFSSIDSETYLVYSVKNAMKKYIKIYALNMDINEKKILNEQEEIYENNIVDQNRHIPTQIRHFIIEQHEYIIVGYRDSSIFVWELVNSEFNLIVKNKKKGEPIKGISLFKDKSNNELTIISSERGKSTITISNFLKKNIPKPFPNNNNNNNNIYFLDIHEKNNENYIILGLFNEVITFKYIIFRNIKHYKNPKTNSKSDGRGHESIIIYEPQDNKDETKLIDSDTEGKCINIFNFDTTELLLILNLKICKPLGINIWNDNNIIVSCLEDEENNSIKIIKVNLNKKYYNQTKVDLNKNEDGTEAKIVYSFKAHEGGTLSTMNMRNREYEFFVSIGKDNRLKLWESQLKEDSKEITL